jgi:hypothetical protein
MIMALDLQKLWNSFLPRSIHFAKLNYWHQMSNPHSCLQFKESNQSSNKHIPAPSEEPARNENDPLL